MSGNTRGVTGNPSRSLLPSRIPRNRPAFLRLRPTNFASTGSGSTPPSTDTSGSRGFPRAGPPTITGDGSGSPRTDGPGSLTSRGGGTPTITGTGTPTRSSAGSGIRTVRSSPSPSCGGATITPITTGTRTITRRGCVSSMTADTCAGCRCVPGSGPVALRTRGPTPGLPRGSGIFRAGPSTCGEKGAGGASGATILPSGEREADR